MLKEREDGKSSSEKEVVRSGETVPLCDVPIGNKAVLLSFTNDNKALRRRLLDMGFTKGVEVEVKKIAPLGDPYSVSLRGYELCLRKGDMEQMMVRVE
jgi:ferrous iron transport protein A